MIRDIVIVVAAIGVAIYFIGYMWSAVLAYRTKSWGWLIALLCVGPITYPFYAVINRSTARVAFRCFWIGLAIAASSILQLMATSPNRLDAAAAALRAKPQSAVYSLNS